MKFRPMHTARLLDLICMVSILNCLMFEDDFVKGQRKLSDLSKLMPHNFYGNIPSTDVQFLFHKWQTKYKEYTENVIEHCRNYQKNHTFLTEVCLDIKNFFPSVPSQILYNFITNKLSSTYSGDENSEMLKLAVTKLLFFKVGEANVEPWKEHYYPEGFETKTGGLYMNCGIPQGLPQSYFFGNLCMIEVKNRLMDNNCFEGDAYFYVDDSVIYVQAGLNEVVFDAKISKLNSELETWCTKVCSEKKDIANFVAKDYLDYQDKIEYKICFHEKGKSVFTPIDDADNHFGPIENLTRATSMSSNLAWNLDEIDDQVSLEKLKALVSVITSEIDELKKKAKSCGDSAINKVSSQLKRLFRLKRFFLYRERLLEISDDGDSAEEQMKKFKERFLKEDLNLEEWFEQNDEDIFQSEYRLLIQKATQKGANKFVQAIKEFEIRALKVDDQDSRDGLKYLYFSKDTQSSNLMKALSYDCYGSLIRLAKRNYSGLKRLSSEKQMEKFREFMGQKGQGDLKNGDIAKPKNVFSIFKMIEDGPDEVDYTSFVSKASSEYQRRIINVYFSEIIGVQPSDELIFTKANSRKFQYTELRILAYLRNKKFDLVKFEEFIEDLDEKDISNCMSIDMGLLGVLNKFIMRVKNPEWVDGLILTHRITKGLWYNGSKFLNSYTLHNEEHAVTLIDRSLELTNRIDYFALKNVDYYILFLACYLHDISMVIHPDLGILSSAESSNLAFISDFMIRVKKQANKFSKIVSTDSKNALMKDAGKFLIEVFNGVYGYFEAEVRDHHASDSAKFIRDKSNTLLNYLEPTLLSFVAKVSESHGYEVEDVYGLKSSAKNDTISLKYLMILIRLADLLDVTNDRVNYHLLRQNLKNLSPTSKFHWISHLVTDRIELKPEYSVRDKKVRLDEKPIIENININLFLNFKQLTTATKKDKCKCCNCHLNDDCINVEILSGGDNRVCEQNDCTVLCMWMMKKHEWLVSELVALNDYLFSVNNSLIMTKINFNIHYSDDVPLDPDMFDYVQEYLGI